MSEEGEDPFAIFSVGGVWIFPGMCQYCFGTRQLCVNILVLKNTWCTEFSDMVHLSVRRGVLLLRTCRQE